MLERLKDFVRSELGLPPDVMLVFIGLGLFLATSLVARRPLTWAWALIPGLCVSIFLESAEIWGQYGIHGLVEKDAKEIATILLRHSRDILTMNLVPLVVVVVANVWVQISQN